MSIYLDSGVLVKFYVYESNSKEAIELIQSFEQPILFTRLHELEIKNGIRTKAFRREITSLQAEHSLKLIESDLSVSRLVRTALVWNDVYDQAESLSHQHAIRLGCRSLDILHVAAALTLKANQIITTDQRQGQLARAVNLQVMMIS